MSFEVASKPGIGGNMKTSKTKNYVHQNPVVSAHSTELAPMLDYGKMTSKRLNWVLRGREFHIFHNLFFSTLYVAGGCRPRTFSHTNAS